MVNDGVLVPANQLFHRPTQHASGRWVDKGCRAERARANDALAYCVEHHLIDYVDGRGGGGGKPCSRHGS